MIQNLKRNWLAVSKLTWGIWQILIWALKNLRNLPFHELLLNKVYIVWAKKVQRSYVSKMKWEIWQVWLKNSDSVLESKMAELNQNKNSKQLDRIRENRWFSLMTSTYSSSTWWLLLISELIQEFCETISWRNFK